MSYFILALGVAGEELELPHKQEGRHSDVSDTEGMKGDSLEDRHSNDISKEVIS